MTNISSLRQRLDSHHYLGVLSNAIIKPLDSESHSVFYVESKQICGALKWVNKECFRFIKNDTESHNETIAIKGGIAPRVLYADDEFKLTEWISDACHLTANDFYNDQIAKSVVEVIARLHNNFEMFANRVSILDSIEWNIQQSRHPANARARLQGILTRINLEEDCEKLVCCHGDLVCENILVNTSSKKCDVKLIDWEYSHCGSVYWDLANLCYSAKLDETRRIWLLNCYTQFSQVINSRLDLEKLDLYIDIARSLTHLWQENKLK